MVAVSASEEQGFFTEVVGSQREIRLRNPVFPICESPQPGFLAKLMAIV
ncbi:hypothetical protein [[Phormidium] sp. ETS-05]|nr:hypothetical protein [[Phormidium] sp. ETS-05]